MSSIRDLSRQGKVLWNLGMSKTSLVEEEELFSSVWFLSKVSQRIPNLSSRASQLLSDNEFDVMLVKKLKEPGLIELGISPVEATQITRFATQLEQEIVLEQERKKNSSSSKQEQVKNSPNKMFREELYSTIWLVSRLTQTKQLSQGSLNMLRENEMNVTSIRKLQVTGLVNLGISKQEAEKIVSLTNMLESSL